MTRQLNLRVRGVGQGIAFTLLLLLLFGGTRIGPPGRARPPIHLWIGARNRAQAGGAGGSMSVLNRRSMRLRDPIGRNHA